MWSSCFTLPCSRPSFSPSIHLTCHFTPPLIRSVSLEKINFPEEPTRTLQIKFQTKAGGISRNTLKNQSCNYLWPHFKENKSHSKQSRMLKRTWNQVAQLASSICTMFSSLESSRAPQQPNCWFYVSDTSQQDEMQTGAVAAAWEKIFLTSQPRFCSKRVKTKCGFTVVTVTFKCNWSLKWCL